MGRSRWLPSASHCRVSCSSQRRCPSALSGGPWPMALVLAGPAMATSGLGRPQWPQFLTARCPRMGTIAAQPVHRPGGARVKRSPLRSLPMPQVPRRHVARALPGPLQVLIRPVDLSGCGPGGVERRAGDPVEQHVVTGVRGEWLGHGASSHRRAGGRKARAGSTGQRGATQCRVALGWALVGLRGFRGGGPKKATQNAENPVGPGQESFACKPASHQAMHITIGRAKRGLGGLQARPGLRGPTQRLGQSVCGGP